MTAILVDLATRGHLRFEETKVAKKEIGRKLVRGKGSTSSSPVRVAVGVLSRWPARTAAGARAMADANAYADALRAWARRPNDPEVDATLISLVFPYAVAFGQANGFASDWSKVFNQLEDELPWYAPAKGSGGEASRRVEALAGIVDEPRPRAPKPRSSVPSHRSSSYRTYTTPSWMSSRSSDGWSSGGGFSGDSGSGSSDDSGGGSVGGGDGGWGGSSW